jgi:hypothetical protein
MRGGQFGVIARRLGTEMSADGIDNGSLGLGRGDAGDGACVLRPSMDQGRGDVVAMPCCALAAVAQAHAIAAVIELWPAP